MQTNYLSRMLFQIKDSAIFLGCLYFIVFILLLPEFAARQGVVNGIEIVILGAISVLVVHLLLNWLYVAVTIIPLVTAAIFFIVGCTIWLFAPIILFSIEGVIQIATLLLGGGINLALLNEFLTRVGQLLMIISGALWWVVNKTKDLNYKALVAYIILVILFGILIGMTSFTRLAGILLIWLVIYSKVKGDENIPDLTALFKVAATVAVIFGVFSVEIAEVGKNYLSTQFSFASRASSPAGLNAFISLYKMALGGLVLTGVWRPNIILSKLPYKKKIQEVFSKVINSSFVKL